MPGNILAADAALPRFTGEESTEEKMEKMSSYLFMLLEQLRYTMANLDKDNFNPTGLEQLGAEITGPLRTRVESAEGDISQIRQDAESITLSVANGVSSSMITLKGDAIGVQSKTITFSGMVKFSDLAGKGYTEINGDNITSGTIRGRNFVGLIEHLDSQYTGGEIVFRLSDGANDSDMVVGGLRPEIDSVSSGGNVYKVRLYAASPENIPFSLKLESDADTSYESTGGDVYIMANHKHGDIHLDGNVYIKGVPLETLVAALAGGGE